MIKGLLEGKRWAALWKALPEYYVLGFIMTLKISIVGLLGSHCSWELCSVHFLQ